MEISVAEQTASLEPRDSSWVRSGARRAWLGISAGWAAITGLAPHVLHHAGPLAGAALFAGVGGSLLFGALGLVLAIPFLRRLHRRFGTWQAPAIALTLFTLVFSVSTFVVGPAITDEGGGGGGSAPAAQGAPADQPSGHEAHH